MTRSRSSSVVVRVRQPFVVVGCVRVRRLSLLAFVNRSSSSGIRVRHLSAAVSFFLGRLSAAVGFFLSLGLRASLENISRNAESKENTQGKRVEKTLDT